MELVSQQFELFSFAILRSDPMTDDEFLRFCADHEDLRIESNQLGEIEIMPGTGPDTGDLNAEIGHQLRAWNKQTRLGRSFDSSTMFALPSGARRSPDASWIAKSRINALPPEQLGHLWHICPEFIIKLRSPSDRLSALRLKMREWIANGTQLAWLIDPEERTVAIYRAGQPEPQLLKEPATVAGEGPVTGFTLDLTEIWEPV